MQKKVMPAVSKNTCGVKLVLGALKQKGCVMRSGDELEELYLANRAKISARLNDFKKMRSASNEKLFYEMCYCVLTAHGSARSGREAEARLKKCDFFQNGEMGDCLKNVRYLNNKTKFLLQNRKNIIDDKLDLREFLTGESIMVREKVANDSRHFKGLGMKASSQFLRNIGFSNLAILDRHILKSLREHGAIKNIPGALTKRKYIEIEKEMQKFAKRINVPMDALDILFWTEMSGEEVGVAK